jgi:hypothetical protein
LNINNAGLGFSSSQVSPFISGTQTCWSFIMQIFVWMSRVTMWGVFWLTVSICVVTSSRSEVCEDYDHVTTYAHKCD